MLAHKTLLLALIGTLTLASCNTTVPTCPEGQMRSGQQCVAKTGTLVIVNPERYAVKVTDKLGNEIPSTRFGAMAEGEYEVEFSLEGFVSETRIAEITAGQTYTVTAPRLVEVPKN